MSLGNWEGDINEELEPGELSVNESPLYLREMGRGLGNYFLVRLSVSRDSRFFVSGL